MVKLKKWALSLGFYLSFLMLLRRANAKFQTALLRGRFSVLSAVGIDVLEK